VKTHDFIKARRHIDRRHKDRPGRAAKAFSHLVLKSGATTIIKDRRIIGWRMKDGHVVCVKSRYPNEERARLAIENIQEATQGLRVPTRAYFCVHCYGWHLTSQEFKRG